MNLAALMEQVDAAPMRNTARPQRWAAIYPAYEKLIRKGYRNAEAVAFLAKLGAIPKGDEDKAQNAFQCITHRRNKKASPHRPALPAV